MHWHSRHSFWITYLHFCWFKQSCNQKSLFRFPFSLILTASSASMHSLFFRTDSMERLSDFESDLEAVNAGPFIIKFPKACWELKFHWTTSSWGLYSDYIDKWNEWHSWFFWPKDAKYWELIDCEMKVCLVKVIRIPDLSKSHIVRFRTNILV